MAFNGVRSSCDSVAGKTSLARFAVSASQRDDRLFEQCLPFRSNRRRSIIAHESVNSGGSSAPGDGHFHRKLTTPSPTASSPHGDR
jgi:hypothetical protein